MEEGRWIQIKAVELSIIRIFSYPTSNSLSQLYFNLLF